MTPFVIIAITAALALVALALIGKSWSAQSGLTRVEVARIEAQKRQDDLDADLSMALREAEEARKDARAAKELADRFDSRLGAVENRARAR
jgi:hypothetical protein